MLLAHLDAPTRANPLGVKGIGEGPAIGAPASFADAVDDTIEGRAPVNRLPLSPHAVWELLQSRR